MAALNTQDGGVHGAGKLLLDAGRKGAIVFGYQIP